MVTAQLSGWLRRSRWGRGLLACMSRAGQGLAWPPTAAWTSGGAYLSILGFGAVLHRALGDGFRVVLLLTIVLVFLQFLVLLRRFS